MTFFLPSIPINFNVLSSKFRTWIIFLLNSSGFPASNKKPVLSLTIVSFEPPILLAIIGFSIDCASTDTRPNASGSIEAETIVNDKTGFLFEAGKPEELSKKIIHALNLHESTLKFIGIEGRKNVIKKFNIEKMCFSTYSEYKKLIN